MADLTRRAREALVNVTPGPWSYNSMGEFGPAYDDDYQAFGMICDPVGKCDWPNAVDNASFIAAARDLVPAMAARLEAQEVLLREAMCGLSVLLHVYDGVPMNPIEAERRATEARATLAKLRAHLGETE